MSEEITQEKLKNILEYNFDTGIFIWKVSNSNAIKIGDIAGSPNKCGYIVIQINNKAYLAHRLAWLYIYGKWPKKEIDHINGVECDNRFFNLRDVSHQENGKNQKLRATNTSGVTGVGWHKSTNRWVATIRTGGRCKYLGCFNNLFDAACVRKSAEYKYGYHKNHGRR